MVRCIPKIFMEKSATCSMFGCHLNTVDKMLKFIVEFHSAFRLFVFYYIINKQKKELQNVTSTCYNVTSLKKEWFSILTLKAPLANLKFYEKNPLLIGQKPHENSYCFGSCVHDGYYFIHYVIKGTGVFSNGTRNYPVKKWTNIPFASRQKPAALPRSQKLANHQKPW